MALDPAQIQALGTGTSAFIITLVSFFLYLNAYRQSTARALFYAGIGIITWAWFGYFFYLTNDMALARSLRIISLFGETMFPLLLVRVAFVYVAEQRPLTGAQRYLRDWTYWIGYGIGALFLADMAGSHLMVGTLTSTPATTLALPRGPLFSLLVVYFLFCIAVILLVSLRRIRIEHGRAQRAGIMLFGSIVLSLLVGSTGFSQWYGFEFVPAARALAVPLFAVAAIYAITNYRLFNVRIAAAEFLVFGIWTFIFIRILLAPSLFAALPDITLLAVLGVLGFLLIRSVMKELRTRIRLEEVSADLRTLNISLEEKVQERTKALAAEKEHITTVVERLPVGLIETDASRAIVRMNRVAEEFFGLREDEASGDTSGGSLAIATLVARAAEENAFTVQLSTPQKRDLEILSSPLRLGDDTYGSIIIFHDVTKERALERAKSDFIATAMHQLRTPLSALKWSFELLAGAKGLSSEQTETLRNGERGTEKMERLVESLLLTVRTSEGSASYHFETLDIAEMIDSLLDTLDPIAKHRDISIERRLSDRPLFFEADRVLFSYIVQNLVDNAIKYTLPKGTVRVSLTKTATSFILQVSDSGIGISPEDQAHLFERFFRAPRAVQQHTDGTGLGLFIVKSIVEAHGGEISVSSKEDYGTTFTCTFPLSSAARHAA